MSRRTDVPAYYADWFLNRLRAGFLYVKNPMNPRQVSRIELSPDVVDCMVFWTKNPAPMLARLEELEPYPYYFQFTLTGYGRDVEPGLPDKRNVLLPAFQELSRRVGKERVLWRYDPILFNERYTPAYHLRAFATMAAALAESTEKVIISFVDFYAKTQRNMANLGVRDISEAEMVDFAGRLVGIAANYGLAVESCAEQVDLHGVGVEHGCCIDPKRIERLLGCRLRGKTDPNQRPACGCLESVDVGTYNTCKNGCRYCYATFNAARVEQGAALYDPNAPLLCGVVGPQDTITQRKMMSLKEV